MASQTKEKRRSVKMLLIQQNGEQLLIQFSLPMRKCNIEEIFQQAGLNLPSETKIQFFYDKRRSIDFIVTVNVNLSSESLQIAAENAINMSLLKQSYDATESTSSCFTPIVDAQLPSSILTPAPDHEENANVLLIEYTNQHDAIDSVKCDNPVNVVSSEGSESSEIEMHLENDETCLTTEEEQQAKVLVVLPNGDQRLITLELSKENCTVEDVLEQAGISFSSNSEIQCISRPCAGIDYLITIGIALDSCELMDSVKTTMNEPQVSEKNILEASPQLPVTNDTSEIIDEKHAIHLENDMKLMNLIDGTDLIVGSVVEIE